MPNISELFPGRYIKAETLNGKARTYQIEDVEPVKLSDGSEKPVISFEDERLKLILNKVNAEAIASLYGRNTDNWSGKLVELYPTRTPFGSKMVDAVRVRAPRRQRPPDRASSERPPPEPKPDEGNGREIDGYDGPSSEDELLYEEDH
jgi:hypothetical protein